MKFRNVILAALASVAVFASCTKEDEVVPAGSKKITVKEFLQKKDKLTDYTIEGVISHLRFQDTPGQGFGGFDLTDATGTVSCAFPENLNEYKGTIDDGYTVTIKGKYNEFQGQGQMKGGTILDYVEGEAPAPETSDETSAYHSTITWKLGEGAYDMTSTYPESAIFNNEGKKVSILKLGSSKKGGDATLNIPEGTKEISFYAFSWKGDEDVKVIFVVGEKTVEVPVVGNDGFSGTEKPYKITLAESDKHTLDVTGVTEVTVKTCDYNADKKGKKRIALAAVKATK